MAETISASIDDPRAGVWNLHLEPAFDGWRLYLEMDVRQLQVSEEGRLVGFKTATEDHLVFEYRLTSRQTALFELLPGPEGRSAIQDQQVCWLDAQA